MWKSRYKKNFSKETFSKKFAILLPAGIVLIVILALLFFIKSGFFDIRQIEVKGELSCAQENQLKDGTGISGQNFFLLNSGKILDSLRNKFVCIKDAKLSKFLPDKVRLEVNNRNPLVSLINLKEKEASLPSLIENIATPEASNIDEALIVDDEGVVFARSTDALNLAKVYLNGAKVSLGDKLTGNNLSKALEVLGKAKMLGVNIQQNWFYDNYLLVSQVGLGPKIIFSLDSNIGIQLASLQLILSEAKINQRTIPPNAGIDLKEVEFIDLRFDKPIVRIAPKKK